MEDIEPNTRIIARHSFHDVPGVMIRMESIGRARFAVVKLDGDGYARKLPIESVRRAP